MNIAIVEDHRVIRECLELYFKNRPEFTCNIVVDSVEAFLKSIGKSPELEVVLLDINLPGMTGIEGIPVIPPVKLSNKRPEIGDIIPNENPEENLDDFPPELLEDYKKQE